MARMNNNEQQEQGYATNRVPLRYRMVSAGIVPAPRPITASVQLPPVVMPVSFVPYATDDQPLYTLDEEGQY